MNPDTVYTRQDYTSPLTGSSYEDVEAVKFCFIDWEPLRLWRFLSLSSEVEDASDPREVVTVVERRVVVRRFADLSFEELRRDVFHLAPDMTPEQRRSLFRVIRR